MRPLTADDIRFGEPLAVAIYDREGKLLLEAGYRIRSEQQCESLIERGYIKEVEAGPATAAPVNVEPTHALATRPPGPAGNSSERRGGPSRIGPALRQLSIELQPILSDLLRPEPSTLGARLRALAAQLADHIDRDADAAMASMQLTARDDGLAARPLHCALLVRLVGRGIAMPEAELDSLTCAALSFDCALEPLWRAC